MLLERYGDWWVDTDVLCLSERWPDADGKAVAGWQDDRLIAIGVLALPPALAKECAVRSAAFGDNVVWGQTGPQLLTQVFREHGLSDMALDPAAFYPVHWSRWTDPFDVEEHSRTEAACAESITIHLWHELIRRSGFEKAWQPPRNTFFGRAVERHRTAHYFIPLGEEDYSRQIAFHKAEMKRHLKERSWSRA
jgi:hypothetical protein